MSSKLQCISIALGSFLYHEINIHVLLMTCNLQVVMESIDLCLQEWFNSICTLYIGREKSLRPIMKDDDDDISPKSLALFTYGAEFNP